MADWFASWFDSPYYPILYQHRDQKEATAFVLKLVSHLNLVPGSTVLDLACGRGRHSRTLHSQGLSVTGFDLSPDSIKDAIGDSSSEIKYLVHDMRNKFPGGPYSAIFNLFTSFGYFEEQSENEQVLQNAKAALGKAGIFVLDYLNAELAIKTLVPAEKKQIDGLTFRISRAVEGGRIVKRIEVEDEDQIHRFSEHVQAFSHSDLQSKFEKNGFEVIGIWGDYQGNPFDSAISPRCILFAKA